MDIENGTIRQLEYGFLLAFHSNYGHIFRRFDTTHEHTVGTLMHRTTTRTAKRSVEDRPPSLCKLSATSIQQFQRKFIPNKQTQAHIHRRQT